MKLCSRSYKCDIILQSLIMRILYHLSKLVLIKTKYNIESQKISKKVKNLKVNSTIQKIFYNFFLIRMMPNIVLLSLLNCLGCEGSWVAWVRGWRGSKICVSRVGCVGLYNFGVGSKFVVGLKFCVGLKFWRVSKTFAWV